MTKRFADCLQISSLRTRLLLLVLISVLPALGLIVYTGMEQRRMAAFEAEQDALHLIRNISAEKESLIDSTRQLLSAVAQLPAIVRRDPKNCSRRLAALLKEHDAYTNLAVADPDGDIFCSALPMSENINIADRGYFQTTVDRLDFAIGDYQIGRITGKAAVNFGYPVLDNANQLLAVVIGAMDLSWFNRIATQALLPPGSVITVRDRNGTILARFPDSDAWVGKSLPDAPIARMILSKDSEGTARAAGVDNVKRLYAFKPFRFSGKIPDLYVSVGIPANIAFAEADRILKRNVTVLGLVGLIAFLAAWIGSEVLVLRNVNPLLRATQKLSEGDFSVRTGVLDDRGELGQLARAFDEMAADLEARESERKRAEDVTRRHLERIRGLREIDAAITSTLERDEVLDILLKKIHLFVPRVSASSVRLRNKESGALEPIVCWNLPEQDWRNYAGEDRPSLARVVTETKAPVHITNLRTESEPWIAEFARRHGLVTYLGIPMSAKGEVMGVLGFFTRDEHRFLDEEVDFLSTLSGQAAVAIHNSQLYKETKRTAQEMAILHMVSSTFNQSASLDTALQQVLEILLAAIHADAGSVRLIDNRGTRLDFVVNKGFPEKYLLERGKMSDIGTAARQVLSTGEPIVSHDLQADPLFRSGLLNREGFRSAVYLPVRVKDQTLGILNFASRTLHRFDEQTVNLLTAVCHQLGLALDNSRLFQGTQRNLEQLRALHEIDLAMNSSLDLDTILNVLLEKIDLIHPYSAATVRLYDRESNQLQRIACRNLAVNEWQRAGRGRVEGLAQQVLETKAPVMIRDINQREIESPASGFFRRQGFLSFLGIPLIVNDEIIGILSFYTKQEHEFTADEVQFLTTLGDQAAVVIQHCRFYERIQKQAAELEQVNKLKSEFLSVMSHELRTPLNVIMGYTGMVREKIFGDITPDQEKALARVMNHSAELLGMVNGILDVTQIEAREIVVDAERVDLGTFLHSLRSACEAPRNKNVTIAWEYSSDLPIIQTDPDKLKRILQNLISNAVKFTEIGQITVSARSLPDFGGVEFKVSDTGPGIDPSSLPIIFEMFRQIDSTETRLYGGMGLGLYIVKKFTDLLGGHVDVETKVGAGSVFTVTLPIRPVKENT